MELSFDSLSVLLKHKEKLHDLMTSLELPILRAHEIEFLGEYVAVLAPLATAIDRLQGDNNCYHGELLPTLLRVESKLKNLQSGF